MEMGIPETVLKNDVGVWKLVDQLKCLVGQPSIWQEPGMFIQRLRRNVAPASPGAVTLAREVRASPRVRAQKVPRQGVTWFRKRLENFELCSFVSVRILFQEWVPLHLGKFGVLVV